MERDSSTLLGQDRSIFTGQDLYRRVRTMLLGDLADRRRVRDWEDFLSRVFFHGQETALIPREGERDLYVKVGNERERPISHLGDGVQAILVLTALPFLEPEPALFFVEEPETHLHPGLQRVFLDAWRDEPALQRHVLFATTHSNHLLELTAEPGDVSVFAFEKDTGHARADDDEVDPRFRVRTVSHGDWSPLRLLGVTHASVLLANAVLLVEGIWDRVALRALLASYGRAHPEAWSCKEDLHYAFVEHAGSNITHWDFGDAPGGDGIPAKRVLAHTLVIVDGDGAEEGAPPTDDARVDGKRARHEKHRQDLGDEHFLVLPCRTIENLVPPKLLAEYVEWSGEGPFPDWQAYRHERLGDWLNGATDSKSWSDHGDVKNKRRFWERVGPRLASFPFEELPEEVRALAERIATFVRRKNVRRG